MKIPQYHLPEPKPWFPYFSIILLVLGGAWIWSSRIPASESTNGLIPAPRTGFLAPDFSVVDQAGSEVRLSDFRGTPVILNIWASWCTPCRAEMPALESTYLSTNKEDLIFLLVNSTQQDSQSAAIAFAQELHLTIPLFFDVNDEATKAYQVRALPSTFFIDANGIIQEVVIGGPMSEALLQSRANMLISEVE